VAQMTFQKAKKLHNEDEVILKQTGEVLTVTSAWVEDKTVHLECVDYENSYYKLTHKQVQ
jgi:predicted double-glycine peptidase